MGIQEYGTADVDARVGVRRRMTGFNALAKTIAGLWVRFVVDTSVNKKTVDH